MSQPDFNISQPVGLQYFTPLNTDNIKFKKTNR